MKTYENNNHQEMSLYQTRYGVVKKNVQMVDKSVWLTKDGMTKLFDKPHSSINKHFLNIFKIGGLTKGPFAKKSSETTPDRKYHLTNYYNLDVNISVGYRALSQQRTKFRKCTTKRLNEHIRENFTLEDVRLKDFSSMECWKEHVGHIRDNCSSEIASTQQVLDFRTISIDYYPKDNISAEFLTGVQSKSFYRLWTEGSRNHSLLCQCQEKTTGLNTYAYNKKLLTSNLYCIYYQKL